MRGNVEVVPRGTISIDAIGSRPDQDQTFQVRQFDQRGFGDPVRIIRLCDPGTRIGGFHNQSSDS